MGGRAGGGGEGGQLVAGFYLPETNATVFLLNIIKDEIVHLEMDIRFAFAIVSGKKVVFSQPK